MAADGTVSIGVLGAARITRSALVHPAADLAGVRIAAIAARDSHRAREYARKNGIPEVHTTYESLLEDPTIDAIYNPLPAALHGEWTKRAIAARKHVLCEKPFAANADEAASVADVAEKSGLVVMEAFHYRYHPLMLRLVELARSGEIGELTRVEAAFCTILPPGDDIRWSFPLGGGSTMDVGCYAIHLVRSVAGEEPSVLAATAKVARGDIDRSLTAELLFPSGATGRVTSSMFSARGVDARAVVTGTKGSVAVLNPFVRALGSRFTVRTASGTRRETFPTRSTYSYQLEAFRDAVLTGAPILTGPADAVANMAVIDEAYRTAGMRVREPLGDADAH